MNKYDGKNAGKPINLLLYILGFCALYAFHVKALCIFGIKSLFSKDKATFRKLKDFHSSYFHDILTELHSHRPIIFSSKTKLLSSLLLLLLFLGIFFSFFSAYKGPAEGYWDTYISTPALLMINRSVDYTDKHGTSLFTYSLPGKLPHNLVHRETYDVASKDQRIGSAIFFAPFALIFNIFGFHFIHALIYTLAGLLFFLTLQKLIRNTCISILGTVLLVCNSYVLSLNNLNPNGVGLFFISLILYLVLSERKSWLLIGFIFGIFGGVRNISILFTPALIFYLCTDSKHKMKDIVFFLTSTFIGILPILIWKQFAFGNFLMHPSQYSDHEGFRPVFEHAFLFWKFNFNGMFNYPLYEKVIRTPYFVFPTFLTLPLMFIREFGIILTSVIIIGFCHCLKYHRKIAFFLGLWFFPIFFMFAIQENWSEMKSTFILLFIHPPILWITFGLHRSFILHRFFKTIVITFILSCILFLSINALASINFEVDNRWYGRFPRAKENIMSFIGDDLRTEPENSDLLAQQRQKLTQGNILPSLGIKNLLALDLDTLKSEQSQKSLRTVDFWKYIYGDE